MPTFSSLTYALVLAAALCLTGCGGGGGGGGGGGPVGPCESGGGPTITITGQVTFVRLVLGISGLGPATEVKPARHVDVEIHDTSSGACYGRTSTDASGNYTLVTDPPAGSTVEIVAYSRTLADLTRDLIVHEADPPVFNSHAETDAFRHASSPFTAAAGVTNVLVPYTGGPSNRPSIGFGVLDTLIACWDEVDAALVPVLPRCHAYTRVGNNFALSGTSYYNDGAKALAFLGGSAGLPDNSDTDYFDDAVVAHEFMHFTDHQIGHSMSRGGAHGGQLLEPNFSWSEGAATGYGCLLLRDPNYIDSTTTSGGLLFRWDIENVTAGQSDSNTIADEATVAEIVWDVGDGGAGPADTDGDGINATYAQLLGVLDGFDPATDAPYIGLFLDRVVATTSITAGAMGAFLSGPPENQQISYPLTGSDVWPTAIGVGGSEVGLCDANVPNCSRAWLSSRWFQFTLATAQNVTIDLTISPLAGTSDNLDLYLMPNTEVNFPIGQSTNSGATAESITGTLQAGTYIIRVEANCGDGSRANFTLTIN